MGRKEKSYKRRIKEKQGMGFGENYKPWANHRFASKGVRTRASRGLHNNREHIFYSLLEYYAFLLFDLSDGISDIQEQYPLEPMEQTMLIAEEIGVIYSKEPDPHPKTVDLLVSYTDGRTVGYQIKLSKDLNKRTLEKFEIERIYLERRGYDFKILTEKEINKVKARNIEDFMRAYDLKEYLPFENLDEDEILSVKGEFYQYIIDSKETLLNVTRRFETDMDLPDGAGLLLFKHMVIRKEIRINMDDVLFNPKRIYPILEARDLFR